MFKMDGKTPPPGSAGLHDRPPGAPAGSGMIWLDPAQAGALEIVGSLQGAVDIAVNVLIRGELRVDRLTLAESGVVEGSVIAREVEVRGRVHGDIHADLVRLRASSSVTGDITTRQLGVDLGAVFEGVVRRLPEPRPEAIVHPLAEPPAPDAEPEPEVEARHEESDAGDLTIPAPPRLDGVA